MAQMLGPAHVPCGVFKQHKRRDGKIFPMNFKSAWKRNPDVYFLNSVGHRCEGSLTVGNRSCWLLTRRG